MKRDRSWQLQEAKAHLSELVKAASDGPQEITVHGRATAVVLSKDEFDRLQGRRPSFVEFMRRSPLRGVRLRIERDRSPARSVQL